MTILYRLRRTVPLLLLATAGLLSRPALADVITFDGIGDGALPAGATLDQAGYNITLRTLGALPPGGLAGLVVAGAAPQCYEFYCPGSSSNYLTSVNGSMVDITRTAAAGGFQLSTFDAVFGSTSGAATLVRVSGMLADRTVLVADFQSDGDAFGFQHFPVDAGFAGQQFIGLTFSGLHCSGGACVSASQFALDNITTAVPEASTWLLLGAGLMLVAGAARRRRGS